ncbi:hypothetical protein FQN57_000822 [Myotisia sp. PD_48]|nr:hypothetical protein FQN57_000822 [Myotisia sp. PD_48]
MASNQKHVFINIQVSDLARAVKFYEAIGFIQNPFFTSATASCMVNIEARNICVMLLCPDMFGHFLPAGKEAADPTKSTEVLVALSVEKKEDVDQLVEKAVAAGGTAYPVTTLPESAEGCGPDADSMHNRSFTDPDGHIWEATWCSEAVLKAAEEVFKKALKEKNLE